MFFLPLENPGVLAIRPQDWRSVSRSCNGASYELTSRKVDINYMEAAWCFDVFGKPTPDPV
ncbi:MAG: hypothetical protein MI975_28705 [Cytophagales bacterium]|nr:hypothetical protein [Cytophagales bacterium]